jgi:toxin HigB-1
MIGTVKHKALARYIATGETKGLAPELIPRLRRMLTALQAADDLSSLETVPGWRLHPLKGNMKEFWSMSVSGNWRIVFKWNDGLASELDLIDYH